MNGRNGRKRLAKAVLLAALALPAAGGLVWSVRQVKAGAPPDPDRLNFGMVGITRGESLRLNVVNAVLPSELPPGPTRVQLTFVDGDGNKFTNPRTGNPVQREVTLQPGHSAFLLLSYDEVAAAGDGDSQRRRLQLRPVVNIQPDDNGQLPPGPTITTAEVIDNSDGRTRFMLDALPAVQRQSAPAGQ
jgi:hypothetical protein